MLLKENCCIISTINQRKCRWLGHVLRHDVLLRDVLEGRMTGKRTRGRKRLQLMSNMCKGYETAKKRAEERCLWCVSVMGVIDLLLQQNTRRRISSVAERVENLRKRSICKSVVISVTLTLLILFREMSFWSHWIWNIYDRWSWWKTHSWTSSILEFSTLLWSWRNRRTATSSG